MSKLLKNVLSYQYCSSNEDGNKEVSLTYKRTWLDKLLGRSEYTVTFVRLSTVDLWLDKDTYEVASDDQDLVINEVIRLSAVKN